MRLTRVLAAVALAGAALSTAPASALGAGTCPAGSQGVIIEHNGSSTYVCTTAVRDVQQIVADLHVNYSCEICPDIKLPPRR